MAVISPSSQFWDRLIRIAAGPWRSLSFQLSFPVGVVIFIAVALAAYLNYSNLKSQLTAKVTADSVGFAETLKKDTFRSMLADQRGHLYSMIKDVARQPGVELVRIFNAQGTISFSTHEEEIGREVDKKAEACYACHREDAPLARLPGGTRTRIFQQAGGSRILGTIVPIYNQPRCSGPPCHAHPPEMNVLGVLDVDMSLKELDSLLDSELRQTLLFALLLFLGASTIIGLSVIFTVNRAVGSMSCEVDKLAKGDHHNVTPVWAPAELGRLSESIADMAQRVAQRAETMNRRYRDLVLNSPDAIFVMDEKGNLGLVNPAARRILGCSPEEVTGLHLADLVHKEDRPQLIRALDEARRNRESSLLALKVTGAKGDERLLEGRFRLLAGDVDQQGMLGNFMDITDRSSLEVQAARNARMAAVGQTVSGLVPYINNLLHGLNNASYIVDQSIESKDFDLAVDAWRMVGRSVERVSSVAEDLLFYADYRLEEPGLFDLNHLLMDVSHLAGAKASEVGAAIEVQENSDCSKVVMDQKAMRRSLLNLVHNSLDALKNREQSLVQGQVVLGCHRTGFGQVEITVEDNGPGIPEEVGRYLFRGLFSTKGSGGTGMGLLLCEKVVEEHGGFITYSCPLQGGTRFTLVIPDQA